MSKVIVMIGTDKKNKDIARAIKYCTEEKNISKIIKGIPNKINMTSDENIIAIRVTVI